MIEVDEKIFEEMKSELRTIGMEVDFIASTDSESSSCRSNISHKVEPTLSLYVSNFSDLGVDEEDCNWSCDFKETNLIRQIWTEKCAQYNISDMFYSPNMLVFIYNLKKMLLYNIVVLSKSHIIKYFESCDCIQPEYVFVGSEPAVRMFYENKKTLVNQQRSGIIRNHKANIYKIIKSLDKYSCFNSDLITIEFLDVISKSDNLYFYARED